MATTIWILLAVICQYAAAIPAPGHGALAGYCNINSDCGTGKCCITFSTLRGKRATLDPNLLSLVSGHCVELGTSGSSCLARTYTQPPANMYYKCPCASNYRCNGTGLYEIPLGEIGVCVQASTLNQPCSSGADCADSECCVADIRPIGKKKRSTTSGHCKAMRSSGSSCLVKMGSGKPDATVFSCPCLSGLTCHGNGVFDIPLGEMGTCK